MVVEQEAGYSCHALTGPRCLLYRDRGYRGQSLVKGTGEGERDYVAPLCSTERKRMGGGGR